MGEGDVGEEKREDECLREWTLLNLRQHSCMSKRPKTHEGRREHPFG